MLQDMTPTEQRLLVLYQTKYWVHGLELGQKATGTWVHVKKEELDRMRKKSYMHMNNVYLDHMFV